MPHRAAPPIVTLAVVAATIGCDEAPIRFRGDPILRGALAETAWIDQALEDLFGTPDEPRLPASVEFLESSRLEQAAGPVISHTPGVTQGLYRRHCARCHGVTGDGRGPAAYDQHPTPRDFRLGVFKWKRTYRDAPPTADDLARVLEHGVPGTAMPSFALLTADEREVLRQYVVYLALRGQVERELVWLADNDLDAGETPSREAAAEMANSLLAPIARAWATADDAVVPAPPIAANTAAVDLGRTLFHSERAGCAKCHGKNGDGHGTAEPDYDDWTRQRVVANPSPEAARRIAADLPIRAVTMAGLAGRKPRGGDSEVDLFRRLHQGVAGTPMPAVGPRRPGEQAALSDDEIAAVVAYVQTLMAIAPAEPPPRIARRGE